MFCIYSVYSPDSKSRIDVFGFGVGRDFFHFFFFVISNKTKHKNRLTRHRTVSRSVFGRFKKAAGCRV